MTVQHPGQAVGITRALRACRAANPRRYLRYARYGTPRTYTCTGACLRAHTGACVRTRAIPRNSRDASNGAGLRRNARVTRAQRAFLFPLSYPQKGDEMVKGGSLRAAMPAAAALVDELRALLGREMVDAALSTGVRLQREHARLAAELGHGHADAWLAAQSPAGPALSVTQAGRTVGLLPGRHAVPRKGAR